MYIIVEKCENEGNQLSNVKERTFNCINEGHLVFRNEYISLFHNEIHLEYIVQIFTIQTRQHWIAVEPNSSRLSLKNYSQFTS